MVVLDFWCGFAEIFILICRTVVLQNQVVCDIWKFSGNFNVVYCLLMLFCVTFRRLSVQFFGVCTPLTPPSLITQMIRDQNCLPSVHWLNPFNQNICQTEFPKFYGVGWNIIIDFFLFYASQNTNFTLWDSQKEPVLSLLVWLNRPHQISTKFY